MTQLMPSHQLNENPAFVWLYSFHMPLFMLMSGLFAKKALSLPLTELIWAKCKQLIIPALLFGVAWFALLASDLQGSVKENVLFFVKHEITCYWFLKSLFICFLVGWAIERGKPKSLALVALWVAFLVLQRWNITCFKVGQMLPFFVLGLWLREHLAALQRYTLPLFVGALVLHSLLLGMGWYTQEQSFPAYFFGNPVLREALANYGIYLITALSGCLLALSACMLTDRFVGGSRWLSALQKIGQYTLWIYLWQKLLLEIVLPRFVQVEMSVAVFDTLFTPLVACVMLVVCYLLALYTQRIYQKTIG